MNVDLGYGILTNPLYGGKILWNRATALKNPETGNRIHRPNPPTEWQTAEAPHLAIVDAAIVAKVKAMRESIGKKRLPYRRRPKHLLSGLLQCGVCDAGMISKGIDKRTGKLRVQCATWAFSRSCSHRRTYYAASILELAMAGLRDRLENQEAIRVFLEEYRAERVKLLKQKALSEIRSRNELDGLTRKISNIVAALADGLESASSVRDTLLALERERDELVSQMPSSGNDDQVVVLHPAAADRYLALIEQLSTGKGISITLDSEATIAFRELVESIKIHQNSRGNIDVEVRSRFSSLLGVEVSPMGRFVGGNEQNV